MPAEEGPPNAPSTSALVTTEHGWDGMAPVPVPVEAAGLEAAFAGELAGAPDGADDRVAVRASSCCPLAYHPQVAGHGLELAGVGLRRSSLVNKEGPEDHSWGPRA